MRKGNFRPDLCTFHVAHTISMADETPGDRLFLIRAACGSTREPESLKNFALRVFRVAAVAYDPTTLSLLERMKQKWRLEDVQAIAKADPLNRGEIWLSALSGPAEAVPMPDPDLDRKLTIQETQRALRTAAREQQEGGARKRRAGTKRPKGRS